MKKLIRTRHLFIATLSVVFTSCTGTQTSNLVKTNSETNFKSVDFKSRMPANTAECTQIINNIKDPGWKGELNQMFNKNHLNDSSVLSTLAHAEMLKRVFTTQEITPTLFFHAFEAMNPFFN